MGSCLGSCVTSASAPGSVSASGCNSNSNSQTGSSSSSTASSASYSWLLWRRSRARTRTGTAATTTAAARTAAGVDEPEVELLPSIANDRCQRRGFVYRILKFKRKQQCPQFLDRYWEQQPSYAKLQNDSALSDIQLQNLDVHKLINANNIMTPSKETELQSYTRMASSRASSSLDLEWEHEYSQLRQYQQQQQKELQQLHQQAQLHQQLQQQQQTARAQDTPPSMANNQPRYASLDQLTTTAASSLAASVQGRQTAARQLRRFGGSLTRTSCCSSTQNSWSHISTPESLEWDIDAEQEQQRQLRQEDDNLDEETLKLLHQIEQLKHHVLQETGDGLSMGHGGVMAVEELSEGLQFRASHFGIAGGGSELEAHIS